MTQADRIQDFMAQQRIAVVGVSRGKQELSRKIFHDLALRGYDVIGVNPQMPRIEGLPCVARVQDINPPAQAALLMVPATEIEHVIFDCAEAGIPRLWIHLSISRNALSTAVQAFCAKSGLSIITGFCPYMFLSGANFMHRLHGFAARHSRAYRSE